MGQNSPPRCQNSTGQRIAVDSCRPAGTSKNELCRLLETRKRRGGGVEYGLPVNGVAAPAPHVGPAHGPAAPQRHEPATVLQLIQKRRRNAWDRAVEQDGIVAAM